MPTNNYQKLKSYGSRILKSGAVFAATGLVSLLAGCGTINSGAYQTIKIESNPSDSEIWIRTRKGSAFAGNTPKYMSVLRKETVAIDLRHSGYNPETTFFVKRANKESLKNLFFLPLFPALSIIDLNSGGAWELNPSAINSTLKKIEIQKKEIDPENDEEIAKYLKMLKDLKDSQAITEEEFNEKRKSLIDKL